MADLRVTNLVPSQPVAGVQQPQVANNQSSPGALTNVSVGSILSGFIINRDASGNPVLRTENGDFTFESKFFLKIGSEISIRIENTGGQTLAHILTINGQPPEVGILQPAVGQEPEVIVSNNLLTPGAAKTEAPAAAKPTPNTVTLGGTLLIPAVTEDGAPAQPAGSQVSLRVISLAAPTTPQVATTAPTVPYSAYARTIPGQTVQTNTTPATPAGSPAVVATPQEPTATSPIPTATTPPSAQAAATSAPQTTPLPANQIPHYPASANITKTPYRFMPSTRPYTSTRRFISTIRSRTSTRIIS